MRLRKSALMLVLLFPTGGSLPAVEVYSWVDDSGVTHFSQWAPAEPVADLSIQTVDGAQPPNFDADEDLYSIRSTAEQTQAIWDEIEQRREDRRAQKQNQTTAVAQQYTQAQNYVAIPYWYPRSDFRPPIKPPRPEEQPPVEMPSVPFRPPRN